MLFLGMNHQYLLKHNIDLQKVMFILTMFESGLNFTLFWSQSGISRHTQLEKIGIEIVSECKWIQ